MRRSPTARRSKGEVPSSHFDALAAEGFYGLAAPQEVGGPGIDLPTITGVLEALPAAASARCSPGSSITAWSPGSP
ncbi:acyl-CoA dehydrogenase family protein [Amycolatopsis sp. lyj-112]|uniref:acyl-CoA dehydrogenase family protein n=1 Tax=Amycolatopsis sp. lyj-112 TaxID=2789288 RepID=UPI00397BC4CE